MKELIAIQSQLKAPKSKYNSFGKYNYRSCEDILEAVKPLLQENDCTLVISDEIVMVGTRYYVKATATIINSEGKAVSNTGLAREDEDKKGMDGCQITGTASSYARKYALNGLFLIDDTKDADTDEYHNQTANGKGKQPKQPKNLTDDDFFIAEAEAQNCPTVEALSACYNKYAAINPNYIKDGSIFMKALTTRKKQLQSTTTTKTTLF